MSYKNKDQFAGLFKNKYSIIKNDICTTIFR